MKAALTTFTAYLPDAASVHVTSNTVGDNASEMRCVMVASMLCYEREAQRGTHVNNRHTQ